MIPVHDLLNRIRWDPEFGRGEFAIGYYDRVARGVVTVPLAAVRFDPQHRFFFDVTDAEGAVHAVPFHRVRRIYKDGRLIWQRDRRA